MKRRALVTGCTGQDGSYLAELLLSKDYEVYGLIRRTSQRSTQNIDHIIDRIKLIDGDLTDQASVSHAVASARPHEIYNLAAQSFVAASFREAAHTLDVTGKGAVHVFEAARLMCPLSDHVRIYQASSSEMFGGATQRAQTEETPFSPRSPYAAAKVYAHHMAGLYRKAYGMHISCGIAFNHESERRGTQFVTRYVTKGVAAIKHGLSNELKMGAMHPKRDWSHAEDIVRAAWLMLQQDTPDDYVLASGESHSVQEMTEYVFNLCDLDIHKYMRIDPSLLRPVEVDALLGCAVKAEIRLGWKRHVSFTELMKRMVEHDLKQLAPDAVVGNTC